MNEQKTKQFQTESEREKDGKALCGRIIAQCIFQDFDVDANLKDLFLFFCDFALVVQTMHSKELKC